MAANSSGFNTACSDDWTEFTLFVFDLLRFIILELMERHGSDVDAGRNQFSGISVDSPSSLSFSGALVLLGSDWEARWNIFPLASAARSLA